MIVHSSQSKIPKDADYLLILGTLVEDTGPSPSLQNRINVAAAYLKENKETIAIASGGKGSNEPISEAEAIAQSLEKQGISKDRIILEDQSARTVENIKYSMTLLPEQLKEGSGIIVSNTFHLYRAKLIAKNLGYSLSSIGAPTPKEDLLSWYFREYLAITKCYVELLFNKY